MNEHWDLTRIYANEDLIEKDIAFCKNEMIPALRKLEGHLGEKESLREYLDWQIKAEEILSKLGMYSSMKSDLDKKNVKNAAALAKVENLFYEYGSAVSYADPEILALGKEYFAEFLKENPEYSQFDFGLEKLFHEAEHTLSGEKEKLISNFNPLLGQARTLYTQLAVGDFQPKKITLSNGKEVEVNQSNWTNLEEEVGNPEDRKKVFEALYSYYDDHKNVLGEIYSQVLNGQLAEVKSRGYSSILASHLNHNKIPESVFLNLIEVASTQSAPLKKYLQIKRKYLGLDKIHSYDRFVQLAKSEKKYTYPEAQKLFWESIAQFPADFQEKAHEVSKDGYVDVYHAPGKRSGAYSNGGENIHPYILLNFEGGLDDVFTLAHESGHSIHTLYAMENQPLLKQGYTIFVAEIASTFNEHNLLDYLLKQGTLNKQDKIFLLQKSIDEIVSTFYRQTLFGHYEYEASKLAERGEPINHEVLSNIMVKLYQDYYGIDIREEIYKPFVWAYIPHLFYTPFYVYQYATSFTASMLIYQNVRDGKPGAFENYIKMLSSGGSMYPIEEVKLAGVDLTSKAPFEAVTKRMAELVDELEKLLSE
ncbi:MAG: oligoendopeptidase F [Bacilli bacterium]|nr:oligoendopeptidase F [Bacilli bacterium]